MVNILKSCSQTNKTLFYQPLTIFTSGGNLHTCRHSPDAHRVIAIDSSVSELFFKKKGKRNVATVKKGGRVVYKID